MLGKIAATVVTLAALGAIAAIAVASSGNTSGRTVVLNVDLSKQAFRDLPPKGNSAGDVLVDRLSLRLKGHADGYGHEYCAATFPVTKTSMQLQCDEFVALKSGGTVTAQGVVNLDFTKGGPQPTTFAITGGTGPYENVRGQITTSEAGHHEVWTLQFAG
jgi:hypothetical protein